MPAAYAALSTPFERQLSASFLPPPQSLVDPYLKAVSDHVIQQEIAAQGADPFSGDAASFWAWLGRMKENIVGFNMKPRAVLSMLSKNTTGAPHLLITSRLSTTGVVDEALVTIVWNELIERFGSQKVASSQ